MKCWHTEALLSFLIARVIRHALTNSVFGKTKSSHTL